MRLNRNPNLCDIRDNQRQFLIALLDPFSPKIPENVRVGWSNSDVPESELEALIPFSDVLDDEEEGDPRLIVIKQIILFQVGYCNGSMSFGH